MNICDNLTEILLNLDGKSKDNEMARKYLLEMGIRYELHLISRPHQKPYVPLACFTLSSTKKQLFYKC